MFILLPPVKNWKEASLVRIDRRIDFSSSKVKWGCEVYDLVVIEVQSDYSTIFDFCSLILDMKMWKTLVMFRLLFQSVEIFILNLRAKGVTEINSDNTKSATTWGEQLFHY